MALNLLRQIFGRSRFVPPAISELCGPEELEKALRRERSRADRTGGEFAVITLANESSSADPSLLYPLIEHIQRRSRSIDELGWTKDGTLWHILPHCSEESAAKVARTFCQQFSTESVLLVYTLYYYSAKSSGNGETPRILQTNMDGTVSTTLANHHLPIQTQLPATLPYSSAGETGTASSIQPAFSVDRLLERPMPLWKRAFDVAVSAAALAVLAPLFALIATAIRFTSPGPALFVQMRSGRGGRPFRMYKFRSMVVDAEEKKRSLLSRNEQDGPAFKMENDPRITKVGRFLRATSLDELPQLWNVLRGEMSLVGPRPLPLAESAACKNWQRQRLDVTPGLTCIWQIKDRRAKIPFVEWARMDIQYAGQRSLGLDLSLIARTVLFVLRRRGI